MQIIDFNHQEVFEINHQQEVFENCFSNWVDRECKKFIPKEGTSTSKICEIGKTAFQSHESNINLQSTSNLTDDTKLCIQENYAAASAIANHINQDIAELVKHWKPENPDTRHLHENAALLRAAINGLPPPKLLEFLNSVKIQPNNQWFYYAKKEGEAKEETSLTELMKDKYGMTPQEFFRTFTSAKRSTTLDVIAELTDQTSPNLPSLIKNANFASIAQQEELSMDFTIDQEDIPKLIVGHPLVSEQKTVNEWRVGIASTQGKRSTMEDTDIAISDSFTIGKAHAFEFWGGKTYAFDLFGVFDGHGGDQVSAFVKQNISQVFKKQIEKQSQTEDLTDENIYKALKETFKNLDQLVNKQHPEWKYVGTTATIAVNINNKTWVANVGDSRTILLKKNEEIIQASEDAKPTTQRYQTKIEKLGGYISFGRILGRLAVARAVGDHDYMQQGKKLVLPNPKITCYSASDIDYIVLACDGLYDVSSTNEVGKAILDMKKLNIREQEMAQRIVHAAIKNGTKDNVSVIVAKNSR